MKELEKQLNELVGLKIIGYFQDPLDGKLYIRLSEGAPLQIVKTQFLHPSTDK